MNSSFFLIPMVAGSLAALVGALTSAIFQYRSSKRVAAGNVDSADARLVFGEAREMITRLREEVAELRKENHDLRLELEDLRRLVETGYCSQEECERRMRAITPQREVTRG